jgi:hypothetical protein
MLSSQLNIFLFGYMWSKNYWADHKKVWRFLNLIFRSATQTLKSSTYSFEQIHLALAHWKWHTPRVEKLSKALLIHGITTYLSFPKNVLPGYGTWCDEWYCVWGIFCVCWYRTVPLLVLFVPIAWLSALPLGFCLLPEVVNKHSVKCWDLGK